MFAKTFALCAVLATTFMLPYPSCLAQESLDKQSNYAADIKRQVQHGLNLASGVIVALNYFYEEHSRFPNEQSEASFLPPHELQGEFVASIVVHSEDGIITITFGNDADPEIAGRELVLSPVIGAAGLTWNCTSRYIPNMYFAEECDPRYSEDEPVVGMIEDPEAEP